MKLDPETAGGFARIALGHVGQEFPGKLDHVIAGPQDFGRPRDLHPAFYGSFDWHSCVHSWWMLLTIRRLFPDLPEAAEIAVRADATFTAAAMQAELAYAQRPQARGFERPYGWAWYAMLHREAMREPGRSWACMMEPLARHFADGWRDYLGVLVFPIRAGTHFNTAFAMRLTLDWAEANDTDLAQLMGDKALHWFGDLRDMQPLEPSGDDFLSNTLCTAQLMQKVGRVPFAAWLARYLPHVAQGEPACLFDPVTPDDRSDGKMAHLDGFNMSRAWSWLEMGSAAGPKPDAVQALYDTSIAQADQHYMSSHWLASFALLALLAAEKPAG